MVKLELYVRSNLIRLDITIILPGAPRRGVSASSYPPPAGLQKMQGHLPGAIYSSLETTTKWHMAYLENPTLVEGNLL